MVGSTPQFASEQETTEIGSHASAQLALITASLSVIPTSFRHDWYLNLSDSDTNSWLTELLLTA